MTVGVGTAVRPRREGADLTQAELAVAVGVTRQTIDAIGTGRCDPSLEVALKLARRFDLAVEDRFRLSGE